MRPCPQCGATERHTKKKGPHTGEYCVSCGNWFRWVRGPWQDFVWPVGSKHRGRKLVDILRLDPEYLEWATENIKKNRLKEVAKEALESQRKEK